MTAFDSNNRAGLYIYFDDDTTDVFVALGHGDVRIDRDDIPAIIGDFLMTYFLRGGDADALVEHILGLGK